MRAQTLFATTLVALLLLATLSGCACSSDTVESTRPDPVVSGETPAASPEPLTLADEELYRALLSIGLERYGLTIDDGEFAILTSMDGYGAVQWTKDDHRIAITMRDVEDEWRWDYTDESVDVNSATPDAFTSAEKAQYLELAKRLIAAVGKDSSDIAELYTWKATGGVMQGDYTFGGPDEDLQVHISSDSEGHLGYVYLTHEL